MSDASGLWSRLRRPWLWVSTTYFAEGYPYALVNTVVEAMVVELGATLKVVGLTSLLHLPWNVKFAWAPWVDTYGTKRAWILTTEVALLVGLALAVVLLELAPQQVLTIGAVLFAALAVTSATHDIAIDGFYLEALDEAEQSKYVGFRAAAYRVAMTVGAGAIVSLGGRLGWVVAWACAAVPMLLLLGVHWFVLPRVEVPGRPFASVFRSRRWWGTLGLLVAVAWIEREYGWARRGSAWVGETLAGRAPWLSGLGLSEVVVIVLLVGLLAGLAALPWLRRRLEASDAPYARSFVDFLAQDRVGRMLALVILFRVGESFLLKMRFAFLRNAVGIEADYYGLVVVGGGGVASIAATLLGGYLISRDGLRRWLWPFVLAQNGLNLLYMVAAMLPDPSELGLAWTTALVVVEHAGAGLGTAVFMVYLMRCCDPRHRAAHMALLTALMSLAFTLAGVLSGYLAEAWGFARYFGFTFLATIPAMAWLPFVPYVDGRDAEPEPDRGDPDAGSQ